MLLYVSTKNAKMGFLITIYYSRPIIGTFGYRPPSFERALAQTAAENAQAAAAAADELREATETAARSEARLRAKIDELRAALRCGSKCEVPQWLDERELQA
jgi:hypothetical protein